MKKIDPVQAISILANIGVIAGIFFLVIEMRQNSMFLRAEVIGTALETRMSFNREISTNPEFSALQRRNQLGENLTDEEIYRIQAGLAATKMGWQKDYLLYQEGILPKEYLDANIRVMKNAFRQTNSTMSHGDHWEETWNLVAAPSFRRFVENCILADCEEFPQ